MDIAPIIDGVKLKVRVVGLVKTPHGFLFEKSDHDYIFVIGGKVSIYETFEDAMRRELEEEVGMKIKDFSLCAVVENLYGERESRVHEINFVYKINDIFDGEIPAGFLEVREEDICKYDIRPSSIIGLLERVGKEFQYILVNEWKK